jgi:hypothetical protein
MGEIGTEEKPNPTRELQHGKGSTLRGIYLLKRTEAEFLDEIHSKFFRVFLLAIHSHLYSFALRFYFFKLPQPLANFYSSVTVHCKGEKRTT